MFDIHWGTVQAIEQSNTVGVTIQLFFFFFFLSMLESNFGGEAGNCNGCDSNWVGLANCSPLELMGFGQTDEYFFTFLSSVVLGQKSLIFLRRQLPLRQDLAVRFRSSKFSNASHSPFYSSSWLLGIVEGVEGSLRFEKCGRCCRAAQGYQIRGKGTRVSPWSGIINYS